MRVFLYSDLFIHNPFLVIFNSENKLQAIPGLLFSTLARLKKFECSDNLLTDLPSEFYECTTLSYVDISNNKISSLSSDVSKLERLQFFDISNNKISGLPPEIGSLTSLEEFIIRNNQLEDVVFNPVKLLNLHVLDLGYNKIAKLSDSLTELMRMNPYMNVRCDGNLDFDMKGKRRFDVPLFLG